MFWVSYSPALTPTDLFFWSYIKDQIYVAPLPLSVENLKDLTLIVVFTLYFESLQMLYKHGKNIEN